MHRFSIFACLAVATACTPASFAATGVVAPGGPVTGSTVTIDVNLTNDPAGATPAGIGAGYAPVATTVAVGDGIRFHNTDGFAHTATAIAGAAFPTAFPFSAAALVASGTTLSGGFSTGSLAAGASSQRLVADRTGTYLFGCFYHYGSPMRAAIVVR